MTEKAEQDSEEEAEEQRREDTALWRQRKRMTRYQGPPAQASDMSWTAG